MERPLVVLSALRGRLFPQVEAEVRAQWPDYCLRWDEAYPQRTYTDFLRTAWAGLGDLCNVEGDVVPPPGAIEALLDCPQPWCSHLCWIGERYDALTLGLVKWSAGFQRAWPKLIDIALTGQRRGGDTYIRGLEEFAPKKYLGYVEVPANVLAVWPELRERALGRVFEPGTHAHPRALDMYFAYEFAKAKVEVHVHQPPATHLRYLPWTLDHPRWQADPRLATVDPTSVRPPG